MWGGEYGLKKVGAFIRGGEAVSVFPDKATGGHQLRDGAGREYHDYSRRK